MTQQAWTPEEWARVEALLETMSQREAAAALGLHVDALEGRLRRRRRAQLAGPSGNAAATTPAHVHAGLQLKGQSVLTDPEGTVKGRWDKSGAARAEPTPVPPDFALRKVSQFTDATGMIAEWRQYAPDVADAFEAARAAVTAHVAEYVRAAEPVAAPTAADADLLAVYPLGDPHIGMLAWAAEVGESFDLRIAERELCECFRQLVARAPNAKRAIVTNLGDFWHATDDAQRTPRSGHKLDVDGRAGKVGRVGLRIVRTIIDEALTKHEHVTFRSLPGNHDFQSAFWLPEVMRAAYAHEPRVHVEDAFNPYQFDAFGRVLLGWCHGDGAKIDALGEIMARDVDPALWAGSRFRVWHTGHVHHLTLKEGRVCIVRTHRTLAGRDAWHHAEGYRSGQGLEVYGYHREWGLDSVSHVGVERVRAALGRAA